MSYNIFNQLQAPLKLALLRGSILLDNKGPGNNEALEKVREIVLLFKEQVKYEDAYIFRMVFEYEPSIWDIYARQHKRLLKLSRNVEDLIASYKRDNNAAIFQKVKEIFNEFMLVNYHHMDDEEEVLNEILSRYYSDDVLRNVAQQMKMQGLLLLHKENFPYATATAA